MKTVVVGKQAGIMTTTTTRRPGLGFWQGESERKEVVRAGSRARVSRPQWGFEKNGSFQAVLLWLAQRRLQRDVAVQRPVELSIPGAEVALARLAPMVGQAGLAGPVSFVSWFTAHDEAASGESSRVPPGGELTERTGRQVLTGVGKAGHSEASLLQACRGATAILSGA